MRSVHLTAVRTISVPFPTMRHSSSALTALSVDAELSPLVRRSFSLVTVLSSSQSSLDEPTTFDPDLMIVDIGVGSAQGQESVERDEKLTVLKTEYRATTNRMLRVAVNGLMESLGVILGVMEELDVDILVEHGS